MTKRTWIGWAIIAVAIALPIAIHRSWLWWFRGPPERDITVAIAEVYYAACAYYVSLVISFVLLCAGVVLLTDWPPTKTDSRPEPN